MWQYKNMKENGDGCVYLTNRCKGWGDDSVNKAPAAQVYGYGFDIQNPHSSGWHRQVDP